MSDGGILLTNGSFADLEKLGVAPREGMRLSFYELDADKDNRPIYLCAEGVLHFDDESRTWSAFIDPGSFHCLPGSDVAE
jgi:hypothetical protein